MQGIVTERVLWRGGRTLLTLCVVTFLAGCAAFPEGTRSEPIPYRLDERGVQLLGSDLRIDFGRTDHSTIPAMTKLVGTDPIREITCGALTGAVWPGDVTLFFASGDFRGWQTAGGSAGLTCASVA